jgi:hypothetical protein
MPFAILMGTCYAPAGVWQWENGPTAACGLWRIAHNMLWARQLAAEKLSAVVIYEMRVGCRPQSMVYINSS